MVTATVRPLERPLIRHCAETREKAAGGYALSWAAHGQLYGVPRSIEAALERGKVVVVNVSRSVVGEALANYPQVVAIEVTALASKVMFLA